MGVHSAKLVHKLSFLACLLCNLRGACAADFFSRSRADADEESRKGNNVAQGVLSDTLDGEFARPQLAQEAQVCACSTLLLLVARLRCLLVRISWSGAVVKERGQRQPTTQTRVTARQSLARKSHTQARLQLLFLFLLAPAGPNKCLLEAALARRLSCEINKQQDKLATHVRTKRASAAARSSHSERGGSDRARDRSAVPILRPHFTFLSKVIPR